MTPDRPSADSRLAGSVRETEGQRDRRRGAYHGIGGWPAEWVRDIEYRDRLLALGAAWDT
jgi:hypothetical protein